MKQETRKLLAKAERSLHASETLLRAGHVEFAAGRAYYAMFHTAQALLRERDMQFRKHGSVHAAFGQHFAKSGLLDPKFHQWLLDAFDERLRGDYDLDAEFDPESVSKWIERARLFLDTARAYLEAQT